MLYIVLFLHQTTTMELTGCNHIGCISYYSYIKPQQYLAQLLICISCISYYSYIKPQLDWYKRMGYEVVYRTIPTSNHNTPLSFTVRVGLYIVLFLHQTTTIKNMRIKHLCCISYYSYIKPQRKM